MSKFKFNLNIKNYMKKNKVRLIAGVMLVTIPVSLSSCKQNDNTKLFTKSSIVDSTANDWFEANDVEVIKTEDGYQIIENIYEYNPVYGQDKKGKSFMKGYEKNFVETREYMVSFEEAERLNIKEKLENKALTKKK